MRTRFVACVLALAASALGQTGRAKFETASIKPSPPGKDMPMMPRLSSGRIDVQNAPVRSLILNALNANWYEVVGEPPWAATEKYNIVATAGRSVSPPELWAMMLPLLEDRFRLKYHRDKREMPVYYLSIVKPGKLPAPRPGNCIDAAAHTLPEPPAPGKPPLFPCGNIQMPVKGDAAVIYGGKVAMSRLASQLTGMLHRPVIDKTGFAAKFDLNMRFALDESLAGFANRLNRTASEPSDPAGAPNIFTALRDQLGLKLDTGKGMVDVYVIDHLERPAAN